MMKLVVFVCLVAKASAGAWNAFATPLAYSAPLAYSTPFAYSAPYAYNYLAPSNYRGPLSLAPGQPANILAADGRPLDTLDVNLDRAAHLTAKAANSGIHLLKKRSAPIIAAPLYNRFAYGTPLAYSAALPYVAPYTAAAHIAPITYAAAPYAHALY